jgi:diphthine-ammonia ligase
MNKAIVLWTGGKDCNLALHEAKNFGIEIVGLVTFIIENEELRAHPFRIMEQQANALDLPYEVISIQEPFIESYEDQLQLIKDKYQIDTIVTGDIAEVNKEKNWITERCNAVGLISFLPLWHLNRKDILMKLIELNFEVIFSFVKEPWLNFDWLGEKIDLQILKKLEDLHKQNGIDVCGENGEYHTIVLDSPEFKNRLSVKTLQKYSDNGIHLLKIETELETI